MAEVYIALISHRGAGHTENNPATRGAGKVILVCWLLVARCWLLVAGCWLLGIGLLGFVGFIVSLAKPCGSGTGPRKAGQVGREKKKKRLAHTEPQSAQR